LSSPHTERSASSVYPVCDEATFASLPHFATAFQTAHPCKHVVVDDLFDVALLQRMADEFYPPDAPQWYRFSNDKEEKLVISNSEQDLPPTIKHFVRTLNAEPFLLQLSALTGIHGLIPDPYLIGAGMHCIPRGGKLEIHADFNVHPLMQVARRLNILIYLNYDWQEAYGGSLELWDRSMRHCVTRIAPLFNRMVILLTDDFSFHGHPTLLTCPADWTRKSIAMYYYTADRPASELREPVAHDTLFQERPTSE